jgi:hypothetical protein
MQKEEVKVLVAKEAHELSLALVQIVKSSKLALKDGFQAGQDVPQIVMQSLPALMKGIEGIEKLPEEAKEMLPEFVAAWMVGAIEIMQEFLKK